PAVLRAQAGTVKVGVLHPVTGPLAYSGTQVRAGALLAVEHINAAGGIKALGGAKIEPVLADAQSKPEVGAAEIDKLNEAGVSLVLGPFA
ncbi:ABC transporter substrate-binding protein, partial [Salmonella enterica]|uniref:ABC transporter substrate-binding protein n=1 Tax=Salmonella enterica TaxID=28901 RepID=UPI003D2CC256